MKFNLLFILAFLSAQVAEAQTSAESTDSAKTRPLISDRPGISESAFLLARGDVQIESGFNYEADANVATTRKTVTYASTWAKFGLSDRCELRIGVDCVRNQAHDWRTDTEENAFGLMPLSVGTKINVLEEKKGQPQMCFIGYLQLPMATPAFRTTYMAPSFKLAVHHTLNQKLSLDYNVGAKWDGEGPQSTETYTLSLGWSLSERTGVFVESYGSLSGGSFPNHCADAGLSYLLTHSLQFDMSGGWGISANSPDGFVNCGFSWRLTKP